MMKRSSQVGPGKGSDLSPQLPSQRAPGWTGHKYMGERGPVLGLPELPGVGGAVVTQVRPRAGAIGALTPCGLLTPQPARPTDIYICIDCVTHDDFMF